MRKYCQVILVLTLVAQVASYPYGILAKQEESKEKKTDSSSVVAQSGADAGDNRYPSGKDRSEEPGKSGNQGKSESDPDGAVNANGGDNQDKIGNTGGFDKADQDNNNGCGNDDDFEDDNKGKCLGHQPKPTKTPVPTRTPTATPLPTPTPCNCTITNNTTNITYITNNNSTSGGGSVLGSKLPNTGTHQTIMGWIMRVLAIGMANIVFLFPSKRWLEVR